MSVFPPTFMPNASRPTSPGYVACADRTKIPHAAAMTAATMKLDRITIVLFSLSVAPGRGFPRPPAEEPAFGLETSAKRGLNWGMAIEVATAHFRLLGDLEGEGKEHLELRGLKQRMLLAYLLL